jgi:hypothetical protein
MRWLVLCTFVLCIASSALAVDTGNKFVMPVKDGIGDGMSDGREGGESYDDAMVITALPYTDSGATCDNRNDITPSCAYSTTADVVYAYTPTEDVMVNVDLCGSGFDTVLEIQQGIGVVIGCNDDYCSVQSGIEYVQMYAGNTYYIIVDGYSTACGSYVLNISAPIQPCVVDCPAGALTEGEPDCYDGYVDNFNGGCNSYPYVFSYICPQPGESTVMCGKSGTYLYGGYTYRDTDWFECYGNGGLMTGAAIAEFPLQFIFIYGASCTYMEYSLATADRCQWTVLGGSVALGTPVWWWVGSSTFSGVPCGSDYVMELRGIWCPISPVEPANWGEIKNLFR